MPTFSSIHVEEKKSAMASSLWAHWDLDVRRQGGVYMLHARCQTNPTSHVVKKMLLTNASNYGISNWTGTFRKKGAAATGSKLLSATNAVRAGPLTE